MTFDAMIERVLDSEGGYVNHPNDPGGETKFGISKRSYPQVDIANLTRDGAKAIYRADFWTRAQCDKLPPALTFQVLDAAVNCGIGTAVRLMQRAAGVADDGHIGPMTLAALNRMDPADAVLLFCAELLEYRTKLSTFDAFGRGWSRRMAKNMRHAAQDN